MARNPVQSREGISFDRGGSTAGRGGSGAGRSPRRSDRGVARHPDRPARSRARAPGSGTRLLSRRRGRLGARSLRARAGRPTCFRGGRQHPPLPSGDAGAPPLECLCRGRSHTRQQLHPAPHTRASEARFDVATNSEPLRQALGLPDRYEKYFDRLDEAAGWRYEDGGWSLRTALEDNGKKKPIELLRQATVEDAQRRRAASCSAESRSTRT